MQSSKEENQARFLFAKLLSGNLISHG